ncbi:MAG: oligosaccharide flippase family protein, partial [Candidatus Andersenbacteria bacterium]|nr:oligosaccharide flippase family protein [Candidatus Andersenbacteria bacterium]
MNLGRVQGLSLATKAVTSALGIVQGLIVVRNLSPGEFGVVGLVTAIGGVIGVSQHLGIVDGAIREIAVRRDRREIGRIFWVSNIVRQLVTIPLSALLLLAAGFIAQKVYQRPEITTLLYIFAGILVLQGLQDVLGATLTGMKRFVPLYGIQITTAAINVLVFGLLTWRWRVAGFFWAMVMTTIIMVAGLAWVIRRDLRGALAMPSMADVRRCGRRILRIAVYMYAARIAFMIWQQLPILMLGRVLADEPLGFLKVSQWFGSKLTIVAMALAEVNLSWMSSLYAEQRTDFRRVAAHNLQRVLVGLLGITAGLLFFTPEILLVAGEKYLPAQELVIVTTLGFFVYALLDIGTSSVFVSADQPRLRAYLYGLMVVAAGAAVMYLARFRPSPLLAAYAVSGSAALSWAGLVWLARKRFSVAVLTPRLALLVLLLAGSAGWLLTGPKLVFRLTVFIALAVYVAWEAKRGQLLPNLASLWRARDLDAQPAGEADTPASERQRPGIKIICFAGAFFDAETWTNRQHIMTRMAHHYPVLYVEPRVWVARAFGRFSRRRWLVQRHTAHFFTIAQWNILPGSREFRSIATINHALNKWFVLRAAHRLGFREIDWRGQQSALVVWLYDTEAAEYLPAFTDATVVYDCVDDHAAQAGVDRNPRRVEQEEALMLERADLVTLTSRRLRALKRPYNSNVHLVLNAGDVVAFERASGEVPAELASLTAPIIGTVGTLDAYKVDFELVRKAAEARPQWQFVLIGAPTVDPHDARRSGMAGLAALLNVHRLGPRPRQAVPGYVSSFDVCIIPYRNSRYNAASFPLKFWEFMASGKPIV